MPSTHPSPADILARAQAAAAAKPHPRHYVDAIRVLTVDKLMTGVQVAAWFAEQGLPFSAAGIHSALTEADRVRIDAAAEARKKASTQS